MSLKNIKCEVSYDGTNYSGFQIQTGVNTIQAELHKALKIAAKKEIKIYASGRTDAGVHAKKQVINFKMDNNIPIEKLPIILNILLPDDIVVNSAEEVPPDFHSRYDAKVKTYRYIIYNNRINNVFIRRNTFHYPYQLDVERMNNASKYFIGEHDFSSFSSVKAKLNRIRIIYDSRVWKEEEKIIFEISGNGFLHNMVRILTGTLINVGNGKMSPDEIPVLFKKKNRKHAGVTVPANGLILWDVFY